jgi:hypothetical protein
MSYPNSALSAGQLVIMAVVVVACLAFWLTAVFIAARDPRRRHAGVTPLPSTAEKTEAEHKSAA